MQKVDAALDAERAKLAPGYDRAQQILDAQKAREQGDAGVAAGTKTGVKDRLRSVVSRRPKAEVPTRENLPSVSGGSGDDTSMSHAFREAGMDPDDFSQEDTASEMAGDSNISREHPVPSVSSLNQTREPLSGEEVFSEKPEAPKASFTPVDSEKYLQDLAGRVLTGEEVTRQERVDFLDSMMQLERSGTSMTNEQAAAFMRLSGERAKEIRAKQASGDPLTAADASFIEKFDTLEPQSVVSQSAGDNSRDTEKERYIVGNISDREMRRISEGIIQNENMSRGQVDAFMLQLESTNAWGPLEAAAYMKVNKSRAEAAQAKLDAGEELTPDEMLDIPIYKELARESERQVAFAKDILERRNRGESVNGSDLMAAEFIENRSRAFPDLYPEISPIAVQAESTSRDEAQDDKPDISALSDQEIESKLRELINSGNMRNQKEYEVLAREMKARDPEWRPEFGSHDESVERNEDESEAAVALAESGDQGLDDLDIEARLNALREERERLAERPEGERGGIDDVSDSDIAERLRSLREERQRLAGESDGEDEDAVDADLAVDDLLGDEVADDTVPLSPELQRERQVLVDKLAAGGKLSELEWNRLQKIDNPDGTEARVEEIQEKASDNENLSSDEQEILKKHVESEVGSVEDQIQDLGMQLLRELEDPKSDVTSEEFRGKLAKLQKLLVNRDLREMGFSEEEMSDVIKKSLSADLMSRWANRETMKMKQVKEQVAELAGLEMQLLAVPDKIKQLKNAGKACKNAIQKLEGRFANTKSGAVNSKERMQTYNYYKRLAHINSQISMMKNSGLIFADQYTNKMLALRKNVGMRNGLMRWAQAKAASVKASIAVESGVDMSGLEGVAEA